MRDNKTKITSFYKTSNKLFKTLFFCIRLCEMTELDIEQGYQLLSDFQI